MEMASIRADNQEKVSKLSSQTTESPLPAALRGSQLVYIYICVCVCVLKTLDSICQNPAIIASSSLVSLIR